MSSAGRVEYLLTRAWEEAIQASGTLVLIGVKRKFRKEQLQSVRTRLVDSQRYLDELIKETST